MAQGKGFEVVTGDLHAASDRAGTAGDELRDLAGGLGRTGDVLAGAAGQPVAADAALAFTARWAAQLQRLGTLAEEARAGLDASAGNYQGTDGSVASAFGTGGAGPMDGAGGADR